MSGHPRRRAAFSLIELTIVILILGIVASVAQPRYASALAAYRVDSAARRVVADLQFAATRARVSSKPVKLQFYDDAPNAFYRFEKVADPLKVAAVMNPSDANTWYTVDLSLEPYAVGLAATSDFTFDIFGMPDQGGEIVVSVGQQSRKVILDAASGEASIQ